MSEVPLPDEQTAKGKAEQAITMNKVVSFHYRLAEVGVNGDRGDWREESHSGTQLAYLHGFHNIVVGLEKALEGKTIGDAIEITLDPDDAYGFRRPNSTQRVPIKHLQFPGPVKKILPGMPATLETNQGKRAVVVLKVGKFNADVDFNHPLAGKVLYYEVQVEGIRDASAEEIAHGHVHGVGGHQY